MKGIYKWEQFKRLDANVGMRQSQDIKSSNTKLLMLATWENEYKYTAFS